MPHFAHFEVYGQSREGRPLILLTLHLGDNPEEHPALWVDAATHAQEWAGVASCLYAISHWVERLRAGDQALDAWFRQHTIYVAPCLSPDGYQHTRSGGAFVRSTLRPPKVGERRVGLEPQDLDGDGEVLWMRWRHPAGPWVPHETLPMLMRAWNERALVGLSAALAYCSLEQ